MDATAAVLETAPASPGRRPAPRGLRLAGVVAGLAVALWFAGRSLPSPPQLLQAAARMNVVLVGLAVVVEVASLWFFARQQQVLFAAFSVRVPTNSVLAITYSRSAMSMALPGGSVVSAVFAVRQFRRFGATRSTAVTVMVLSGLISVVGLGVLYGGWLGVSWAVGHLWSAVLVVIGGLCVVGAVASAARRRTSDGPAESTGTGAIAVLRTRVADVKALPATSWVAGLGLAVANWAADLACLVLVASAFGSGFALVHLGLLYLGVQVIRQIPLSPGGIGVVEASLVAGLVLLGAGPVAAAATTLVYRFLSCWLVLPVGLVCWVALSRPRARSDADRSQRAEVGEGTGAPHRPRHVPISLGSWAPPRPHWRSRRCRRHQSPGR